MEFKKSNEYYSIEFDCIDMEKTGENIRQLVKAKGMTTQKLSSELGDISEQAIYKWYCGRSLPSIDNMVRLKQVLKLDTIDELIITQNSK